MPPKVPTPPPAEVAPRTVVAVADQKPPVMVVSPSKTTEGNVKNTVRKNESHGHALRACVYVYIQGGGRM